MDLRHSPTPTTRPVARYRHLSGFTLLELIVVLTIMGFLIAMVAPKLANVAGSAVDTVCDTNQNRLRGFLDISITQQNTLPNKLVSPVVIDSADAPTPGFAAGAKVGSGGNVYVKDGQNIKAVSDNDPDNGQDILSDEFAERNQLHTHILNAAEATELRKLGLAKVLVYGKTNGAGAAGTELSERYVETDVAAGVPVLMVGSGAASAAADIPVGAVANGAEFGHPELIYRIILGISGDASIKSDDGLIQNAPSCPGGLQNSKNVEYNWYNIVLPRLAATQARLAAGAVKILAEVESDVGQKKADVVIAKTGSGIEAEPLWKFTSLCPEGHEWPEAESSTWTLNLP